MKLYDTNVFPAFSTPIYVSNAVDFEEVIDLENIDQEEFFLRKNFLLNLEILEQY